MGPKVWNYDFNCGVYNKNKCPQPVMNECAKW